MELLESLGRYSPYRERGFARRLAPMRITHPLSIGVLAFWLLSCGDSNGPSSSLNENDILGTWTLTAATGTGNRQCGVIPPLLVPFVSSGVDLGDGRLQFVDSWYFASDPSHSFGPFAAQVSTRDGTTHLQLTRTLDDATLIEGTMRSDGTFTGTITDPVPGHPGSAIFVTFSGTVLSTCTYEVTMQRT
jgi:hypothetical protein